MTQVFQVQGSYYKLQGGPEKTEKSWIFLYVLNYHSMQIENFVPDSIAVDLVYYTHR